MELDKFSKTTGIIIRVASVCVAIAGIGSFYSFIQNNIWTPSINIVSVDYQKAIAQINYKSIFGKTEKITVYGNATFVIGGNWGIRFGTTETNYNRIELVKQGMVYEYFK
jgi:hypothetical protein